MFRGTFTALVTPFRDGAIDLGAFENLIETQIAGGVSGIVVAGTTGESPTLTREEHEQITELAVKVSRRRCKVLAGTGSNSTRDAVSATQAAEKIGVDGALVVAPYYNKPSQDGLFRHFQAIAEATSLPLMLYNIPARCGVDIVAETVLRLAMQCRNVVSIKEAGGSVGRVSELRAALPEEFTILSGDDSLTLPFLSVGAVGVVSVAANLFPSEICALVHAFQSTEIHVAERLHRKYFSLFRDLFIEPNPVPVKTALSWRGTMTAECRLPLYEMTATNQARLKATLEKLEAVEK
jgi:4-hydroxy-tetrahydrodipicolinate synthase